MHKEIYGGLIWLHSYQDSIDKERIAELREAMLRAGFEEDREVLLSILRACAREGEVEEAEKSWVKLLEFENDPPALAFVYKMEVYSKVGMPMKSLDIFREMQSKLGRTDVADIMTKPLKLEQFLKLRSMLEMVLTVQYRLIWSIGIFRMPVLEV